MMNWAALTMGILCALTVQSEATSVGGTEGDITEDTVAVTSGMNGTVPFECMREWLIIAQSGQGNAEAELEASRRSRVDEVSVLRYPPVILELALGLQVGVIGRLQACVGDFDNCEKPAGSDSRPCRGGGECLFNGALGRAACVCPTGLTGARCQTDIDECELAVLNECANITYANCYNLHGSYACECKDGYFGDGRECGDIDECTEGVHHCHQNASCLNTAGSHNCSCNAGFLGNGTTCEGNICLTSSQPGLCMKVQSLEDSNVLLTEKLAERDRYITAQGENMKLITSTMLAYRADMAAMKRESRAANIGHNARLLELRNDTEVFKQRTETFRRSTDTFKRSTESSLQRTERFQERIESFRGEMLQFKRQEEHKCGVVSWKSYTQSRSNNNQGTSNSLVWNSVFNKTREDTVLLISYTSSMGGFGDTTARYYRFSILLDGAHCQSPAPITSGWTKQTSNGYGIIHTPTTITGVCDTRLSGAITLSTSMNTDIYSGHETDGYYTGNYATTSTMTVQELKQC